MANTISQRQCPKCGHFGCKPAGSTNGRYYGDVRRTRRCMKCEATTVSYEISAEDYAMLQALRTWTTGSGVRKKPRPNGSHAANGASAGAPIHPKQDPESTHA